MTVASLAEIRPPQLAVKGLRDALVHDVPKETPPYSRFTDYSIMAPFDYEIDYGELCRDYGIEDACRKLESWGMSPLWLFGALAPDHNYLEPYWPAVITARLSPERPEELSTEKLREVCRAKVANPDLCDYLDRRELLIVAKAVKQRDIELGGDVLRIEIFVAKDSVYGPAKTWPSRICRNRVVRRIDMEGIRYAFLTAYGGLRNYIDLYDPYVENVYRGFIVVSDVDVVRPILAVIAHPPKEPFVTPEERSGEARWSWVLRSDRPMIEEAAAFILGYLLGGVPRGRRPRPRRFRDGTIALYGGANLVVALKRYGIEFRYTTNIDGRPGDVWVWHGIPPPIRAGFMWMDWAVSTVFSHDTVLYPLVQKPDDDIRLWFLGVLWVGMLWPRYALDWPFYGRTYAYRKRASPREYRVREIVYVTDPDVARLVNRALEDDEFARYLIHKHIKHAVLGLLVRKRRRVDSAIYDFVHPAALKRVVDEIWEEGLGEELPGFNDDNRFMRGLRRRYRESRGYYERRRRKPPSESARRIKRELAMEGVEFLPNGEIAIDASLLLPYRIMCPAYFNEVLNAWTRAAVKTGMPHMLCRDYATKSIGDIARVLQSEGQIEIEVLDGRGRRVWKEIEGYHEDLDDVARAMEHAFGRGVRKHRAFIRYFSDYIHFRKVTDTEWVMDTTWDVIYPRLIERGLRSLEIEYAEKTRIFQTVSVNPRDMIQFNPFDPKYNYIFDGVWSSTIKDFEDMELYSPEGRLAMPLMHPIVRDYLTGNSLITDYHSADVEMETEFQSILYEADHPAVWGRERCRSDDECRRRRMWLGKLGRLLVAYVRRNIAGLSSKSERHRILRRDLTWLTRVAYNRAMMIMDMARRRPRKRARDRAIRLAVSVISVVDIARAYADEWDYIEEWCFKLGEPAIHGSLVYRAVKGVIRRLVRESTRRRVRYEEARREIARAVRRALDEISRGIAEARRRGYPIPPNDDPVFPPHRAVEVVEEYARLLSERLGIPIEEARRRAIESPPWASATVADVLRIARRLGLWPRWNCPLRRSSSRVLYRRIVEVCRYAASEAGGIKRFEASLPAAPDSRDSLRVAAEAIPLLLAARVLREWERMCLYRTGDRHACFGGKKETARELARFIMSRWGRELWVMGVSRERVGRAAAVAAAAEVPSKGPGDDEWSRRLSMKVIARLFGRALGSIVRMVLRGEVPMFASRLDPERMYVALRIHRFVRGMVKGLARFRHRRWMRMGVESVEPGPDGSIQLLVDYVDIPSTGVVPSVFTRFNDYHGTFMVTVRLPRRDRAIVPYLPVADGSYMLIPVTTVGRVLLSVARKAMHVWGHIREITYAEKPNRIDAFATALMGALFEPAMMYDMKFMPGDATAITFNKYLRKFLQRLTYRAYHPIYLAQRAPLMVTVFVVAAMKSDSVVARRFSSSGYIVGTIVSRLLSRFRNTFSERFPEATILSRLIYVWPEPPRELRELAEELARAFIDFVETHMDDVVAEGLKGLLETAGPEGIVAFISMRGSMFEAGVDELMKLAMRVRAMAMSRGDPVPNAAAPWWSRSPAIAESPRIVELPPDLVEEIRERCRRAVEELRRFRRSLR